jgi:hypothetical protein
LRVVACAAGLLASLASLAAPQAISPRWSVDPEPVVAIGQSDADTNAIFTAVAGATRLPDGRILVGDRGAFTLRLFSPNGKPERAFGRKGAGPGEINYLKSLLRCGDSLVTMDIDGNRTSVFSLDGKFIRLFRFGSPQAGRPPYNTVCNGRGVFAHHGWELMPQMRGGAYRGDVPFWLSGADSAVRHVVGSFPGSERYGQVANGRIAGSRPLPLGKQPAMALSDDRLYIGSADRYEIRSFDLTGKALATIRADRTPYVVTDEDVANARELEIAERGERTRASTERAWAAMPIPKAAPAYGAFQVDDAGNLWVQDYPRARAQTVEWRVFDRRGSPMAQVALPTHLTVYEIGADYILGRYLDPDESIPQVRMYRLRRAVR